MSKIGPISAIGGRDFVPMGMISFLLFIFMATSVFLILLILCSAQLRKNRVNWFVVNLAAACVVFGATVRPVDIHYMVRNTRLPEVLCVAATLLHKTEVVVVPVAHFLFTSERMFSVAEPRIHESALKNAAALTIFLATPWILGLFVAMVTHFADESTLITMRHYEGEVKWKYTDWPTCHLTSPNRVIYAYYVPLVLLVVSSAGLAIAFCCRRKTRQSIISKEQETYVRGSVIMLLLANCVFVVMLTPRAIMGDSYQPLEPWMYSFLEFLTSMLAIACLPDIRHAAKRCLTCSGDDETPEN